MEILRDEYMDYLTCRSAQRPLFVELFGPLIGLEEEWLAQGATENEIGLTAFGFDHVRWHGVGATTGRLGGSPEETLEETNEYILRRDGYGRRSKLFRGRSTIAHPLEFPVTDMDSWLREKPHYEFSEQRFQEGWLATAQDARHNGSVLVAHIPGGFDEPRQLMGEEGLCMAYYEQPEVVHDMLDTMGETAERVLDRVTQSLSIDILSVHEDVAGKSGPMVGPSQIKAFIAPYYRRIWDMLESRGARVFQQDSDGDIRPVIPAFMDAGVNCMYPMEPAAGMDIVALRETYGPRLAMLGGIDKHVIRESKDAIDAELAYKLQDGMLEGGVVFGLDHRIPNGTPIDNYRYYVRRAREILGLDPDPEPGWARMAF